MLWQSYNRKNMPHPWHEEYKKRYKVCWRESNIILQQQAERERSEKRTKVTFFFFFCFLVYCSEIVRRLVVRKGIMFWWLRRKLLSNKAMCFLLIWELLNHKLAITTQCPYRGGHIGGPFMLHCLPTRINRWVVSDWGDICRLRHLTPTWVVGLIRRRNGRCLTPGPCGCSVVSVLVVNRYRQLICMYGVCIRFIIIGRLVGRNVNSQRVSCCVLAGGMDGEKGVIWLDLSIMYSVSCSVILYGVFCALHGVCNWCSFCNNSCTTVRGTSK